MSMAQSRASWHMCCYNKFSKDKKEKRQYLLSEVPCEVKRVRSTRKLLNAFSVKIIVVLFMSFLPWMQMPAMLKDDVALFLKIV